MKLVEFIGIEIEDDRLHIDKPSTSWESIVQLHKLDVDPKKPYIVAHPGVSERRRQYPVDEWITLIGMISARLKLRIVLTGVASERELVARISSTSSAVVATAGLFTVAEFVSVVSHATACVTVNTSASHIAASVQTPVVVLYALTNPQHTPWKAPSRVLTFSVPEASSSRNEVVKYVQGMMTAETKPIPRAAQVLQELESLLDEYTSFSQLEKPLSGFPLAGSLITQRPGNSAK
jgi:ADP-heptose:LPS heptosyltransferase